MKAAGRRITILAMVVVASMGGCVRSKPPRTLPDVSAVFGSPSVTPSEQVAHAAPTPTAMSTAALLTAAPSDTLVPATATERPSTTAEPAQTATPTASEAATPTSVPFTPTLTASPTASPTRRPATATPPPTWSPTPTVLAGTEVYVVAEGDTLYSIAVRNGTTVAALQQLNDLESSGVVEVGQTLVLPADAVPNSGPQVHTTSYWVGRDESLDSIARLYHTTAAEILAANPWLVDEDRIPAGTRIVVPVNTVLPQRTHLVRDGEAISDIAHQYGVSVRSIVQANGLRNANQVYVGQVLIIPDE